MVPDEKSLNRFLSSETLSCEGFQMRFEYIFYLCVIGYVTLVVASGMLRDCQSWHVRMAIAGLSQAVPVEYPDQKQQEQAKADRLAADRHILALAQQKPFIAIMSSE